MKLLRILLVLVILSLQVVPIYGAKSVDVGITATPQLSGGITGFLITYVNDKQLDFDWGYSGFATKIMIRAKYGGYPNNIPNINTAPTDGYLVYYGDAIHASDTNVDFNNSTLQVYYTAWAQKADGTWFMNMTTGWKESRNMIFIGLLIFALAATVISLRYYNLLLSMVGMLAWLILWGYNLNNPLSGIVQGSFVHELMTYAFMIMAIVTMLVFFRTRGKNATTSSNGIDAVYQDNSRPVPLSKGMMDKSLDEYRQYIRTRSGNKRR
jgi:hypothetical protein